VEVPCSTKDEALALSLSLSPALFLDLALQALFLIFRRFAMVFSGRHAGKYSKYPEEPEKILFRTRAPIIRGDPFWPPNNLIRLKPCPADSRGKDVEKT